MIQKHMPFTKKEICSVIKKCKTPFYIYDEKSIRENARKFYKAFSWIPGGFKNYFAVKATPNPFIIKILEQEGMGIDCSSLTELILAEKLGIRGEDIMFTSNDTSDEEFKKAKELGAVINLDDIKHIEALENSAGIPEIICFRYNPGPLKYGDEIIGNPIEAKFGLTRKQIFEAYKIMKDKGVKKFGLHTMVMSNVLDSEYITDTAKLLFSLAAEISRKLGIKFEFINLGGGIGIPYKPKENPIDINHLGKEIKKIYRTEILEKNIGSPRIFMECGRFVTGPCGFLITKVLHVTRKYKNFVGVDASMADLMRPGMYRAYHHITVLGKEKLQKNHVYDVTGSLCENNDKFAVNRSLPKIEKGNILIIHDSGAHGHSMGFQYNGKLRSAEFLLRPDKSILEIRRAETVDDYFVTLDFSALSES